MTDLVAGSYVQLTPALGRLIAPNGGPMTGPGTNSYLLGDETGVVVIDPGPAIQSHVEALHRNAIGPIRKILVTHTHRDHSPGAKLLREITAAEVCGMRAPATPENDRTFRPDKVLFHGEIVGAGADCVRAIHTPGHASNHVCFLLESQRMLFTGDHIMGGSTVVIAPPDGNMTDYLRSLANLKLWKLRSIAPGHGALIDAPDSLVDWTIAHRLEREARVIAALRRLSPCSIDTLLPEVYGDVDPRLLPIAKYSLRAHLDKLDSDGIAQLVKGIWTLNDSKEGAV